MSARRRSDGPRTDAKSVGAPERFTATVTPDGQIVLALRVKLRKKSKSSK